MNFKPSSIFTLFIIICLITITTAQSNLPDCRGNLKNINVISPTPEETIPNEGSINISYETTQPQEGEVISLHVILLDESKAKVYEVVADQKLDGQPHQASVPWQRIKDNSTVYIQFFENYLSADQHVTRISCDIKLHNTSSQDNKLVNKQIVEEIYSRIQHTINPIDAGDRVLVAIIKALIALNNEPSSPRQLADCIQDYDFTQLGGQTPFATVSGHISTHFSRVRQRIIPKPIIGKQPHPTITKRSLYYFLDPDNVLRDLLSEYFPAQTPPDSPTTTISEDQSYADTPTTPSDNKDVNFIETNGESISDTENQSPQQKNLQNIRAKAPTIETAAAPHGNAGDTKDRTKRSYDTGERNAVIQPLSLNYLPPNPTRNPESPRVPLTPDIHIMRINGLEVFTTRAKNGTVLLRRVDNGYVDKYSLLEAGGRRARNSDRKWISLEEAQILASELNIEQNLGILLYERLFDYFDVDLDYANTSNGCCAGLAYWFQCVSPKKIFLE
ncbi:8421_t:CDS:2 [Funneliformis caledonium]|uniref:8421_t:CDS:1 n=1 Tax=Funneliformis caledonium TaxID=1117310 RepID=A0A9N9FY25_9GLOM|nr:8421_t:CDS:2 [Funneliformis caledonium]